jgi:hypothetical protein
MLSRLLSVAINLRLSLKAPLRGAQWQGKYRQKGHKSSRTFLLNMGLQLLVLTLTTLQPYLHAPSRMN